MILTRLHPVDGVPETIDLDATGSRDRLLELYEPPAGQWLRLNFVTTVSGSAAGADGTSETLTCAADRRLLGVIRELADIVLIGAQSVRAEGFQLPRKTRLAVVTASGDLTGHQIVSPSEPGRLMVLAPAGAIHRARSTLGTDAAEFVAVPDTAGRLEPTAILAALIERGLTSIVCEGGPQLAGQLLGAGILDEICLSTAPQLGGPTLPLFGSSELDPVDVTLAQLLRDESSGLYARWLVSRNA
ncbi:MAG: dihydrofolate reductase family protein [Microbacteriaceae bacterium]